MSTPWFVAIERKNGTFGRCVIHSDGYPDYVFNIIPQYWSDRAKLEHLVRLGDVSVFREHIGKRHIFHDRYAQAGPPYFSTPWHQMPQSRKGWTTFYSRDRHEPASNKNQAEFADFQALLQGCFNFGRYILAVYGLDGKWHVLSNWRRWEKRRHVKGLPLMNFDWCAKEIGDAYTAQHRPTAIAETAVNCKAPLDDVLKYIPLDVYTKVRDEKEKNRRQRYYWRAKATREWRQRMAQAQVAA